MTTTPSRDSVTAGQAPRDVVSVDVERPVAGGRMLARHDGRVLLVDGALPGERVQVRVTHQAGGATFASTVAVERASEDRVAEPADRLCGGMLYGHIRYERQLSLKSAVIADAFRRIARRELEPAPVVRASPPFGYRLRARFHVQNGRVGFLREGTHDLCDAASTGQLHPDTVPAVQALADARRGRFDDVAAIVVAENTAATERVVHLEAAEGQRGPAARLPDTVLDGISGITTDRRGRLEVLAGTGVVSETAASLGLPLGGRRDQIRWRRHATSFFQGNRFLTGALADTVAQAARAERVVDLYAGVGLFSLVLAADGASVVAIEADRSAGQDLSANVKPWKDRVMVVRATVEVATRRRPAKRPDTVVVDPPRTGMSRRALTQVLGWRVPKIVYVSCDPPTLARDAAALFAAGYQLTSIEGFDLFPQTAHVETVTVFEREPGRPGA
jgi:23S rRNA (uracil1939-C5)-methyltransferase